MTQKRLDDLIRASGPALPDPGEFRLLNRAALRENMETRERAWGPGAKAALDILGYYGGPVRSPLQDLGPVERQDLKDALLAGGVL